MIIFTSAYFVLEKNDFLGGDYWRQIVFYKILIEQDPQINWQMQYGVMDFVEAEKSEFYQAVFDITQAEQQVVEQQILETYEKIKNLEFDSGCGEESCKWCEFVQAF